MKQRKGTSADYSGSNDILLNVYINCRSWQTAWKKGVTKKTTKFLVILY